MEWIFVPLGLFFALLMLRSVVIVCFPDSDLASWCEAQSDFFGSDGGGDCAGDGGGDGGGD